MRRRILIWSPNYAPELIGIPPLVTDAAEWLASRGHRVDVVTAFPNYPERVVHSEYRGRIWCSENRGDVRVHRSWLRVRPEERFGDKVLYELSFAVCSFPRVIARLSKSDVLVCVVPSLAAASLVAAAVRLSPRASRPRLVLWVQDLVLAAARALDRSPRRVNKVLTACERVETAVVAAADAVVVCSPGFRDEYVRRGVPPAAVSVLHNWVDTDRIVPSPASVVARRFLYAGNVGYTQGLETLVDAARLADEDVAVDIVGAGNASGRIRALARRAPNVTVKDPVPEHEFPALLNSADAHLVMQRAVAAGANLPSKIGPYLASGRPVIASISPDTPAAGLLRESGAALLIRPEDPVELATAMRRLRREPLLARDLGRRAREFAVRSLSRDAALVRFEEILLSC